MFGGFGIFRLLGIRISSEPRVFGCCVKVRSEKKSQNLLEQNKQQEVAKGFCSTNWIFAYAEIAIKQIGTENGLSSHRR